MRFFLWLSKQGLYNVIFLLSGTKEHQDMPSNPKSISNKGTHMHVYISFLKL